MAIPYKTPAQVVTAAATTPAFGAAFRAAPPTIRHGGKTYRRDDAKTVQQQVWYLAAVSMANPGAVASLAYKASYDAYGVDDDVDRSALDAAKLELEQARNAVRAAKDQIKQYERNLREAEESRRECDRLYPPTIPNPLGIPVPNPGFVAGVPCRLKWDGQVQWWKDRIRDAKTGTADKPGLAQLEADFRVAQTKYNTEKERYEAALRAKRYAEERARKQRLADKRRRAQEQGQEREAEELSRREEEESSAAEERQRRAEEAADESTYYPDDGGYYSEDEVIFGDSEWLDYDAAADIYGDVEVAEDLLEAMGEDELAEASPWSFDRYYGCDCEEYDASAEELFFFDWSVVLTGIIASILAIAPALLNALQPPPSVDASAADTNPGAKGIVEEVVERTGVEKILEQHAEKAGQAAKPDLMTPALFLGGIFLLTR